MMPADLRRIMCSARQVRCGVAGIAGAVAVAVSAIVLPTYWVYLGSTVAIAALVARGIGVVTNIVGVLTLCQMSFAAIGGWVTARVLLIWPQVWFPGVVVAAGIAAGLTGLFMGVITARIRGVEFAVVTLGFAAALDVVFRARGFPGVGSGVAVIPGAPFDDARGFFLLCWVVLGVGQIVVAATARSRFGVGWVAVRNGERAAAALGVRVGVTKAVAFGIGASCAGMAGALFAGQYGLLTAKSFGPGVSMTYLVTAVLFGAGIFTGALVAGVASVAIPELLRRFGLPLDYANLLLGIGAFDILRRGNGGLADQWKSWRENRKFRTARTSCALPRAENSASPESPKIEPDPSGNESMAQRPLGFVDSGREGSQPPCAGYPALRVQALTVAFGSIVAVDNVDLSVPPGCVHALIGANGAGKSTLVDALAGFVNPTSGAIWLGGDRIDSFGAHQRARLGLRRTFQNSRVVPDLTVGEYLYLAGRFRSGTREIGADALIERFGLPAGSVPVRSMDVGSRRILEVAATLASAPSVVLLDEPAAGLDGGESRALAEVIRGVPGRFGITVLVIEHDVDFVERAATTVSVMDSGRMIADGPTGQVLEGQSSSSAPSKLPAHVDKTVTT